MTERIAAELLAPVKRESSRDGDNALAGRDAFASLPVLGAVRQFIDNERRRTRRMILSLVLMFAVILVGLVGIFIFVAEVQMRRVKVDLENGQRSIANAASQIGMLKKEITEEAQRLSLRLADGGKQAESALAAVKFLDMSITNAVLELQILKHSMSSVDELRDRSGMMLENLAGKWNSLNMRLDALAEQNSVLRARLASRGEDIETSEPVMAATIPREEAYLSPAPTNTGLKFNWRLPVP